MLQHILVTGNSYFIDTNDIVYVNQSILNVEGMYNLNGAVLGIDSLGTNFIKINDGVYDTYINRKRIIAITNKGVMLDKTFNGPVSIQFGGDTEKEFEKVMKYFDPSDYTEINGWYLVKNKIKTFIPTENYVNGMDMTNIKPVQPTPPTPPGPGPEPEPSDFTITHVKWDSEFDCIDIYVDREGDFGIDLLNNLSISFENMYDQATIRRISQAGSEWYTASLNYDRYPESLMYVFYKGNLVGTVDHFAPAPPPPPTGPTPQTGEDYPISLYESEMLSPGDHDNYQFDVDDEYGAAGYIKTGGGSNRRFGAAYSYRSFWNVPRQYGDADTAVYLPGTGMYTPHTPIPGEQITIYNFALSPSGNYHQVNVCTTINSYNDWVGVDNGQYKKFAYDGISWSVIETGAVY